MGGSRCADGPAERRGPAVVTGHPPRAIIELGAARVAPESRVPYARPAAPTLPRRALVGSAQLSKSWPPPQPPDFIPEGWLPLFEAYKLVGRAQFGDEWMDGRELAAPSDENLEAEKEARARAKRREEEKALHAAKAKRASMGVSSGIQTSRRLRRAQAGQAPARNPHQEPPWPRFEEEERTGARARGDWVWNQLRQWLYADNIPQMVLDYHGVRHTPPLSVWASTDATSILHTGRIEAGDQNGFVFVSTSHLKAAVHGERGRDESTAPASPAKTKGETDAVKPAASERGQKRHRTGRPSYRENIVSAYEELRDAGKVDFGAPKKFLYPCIREMISGESHTVPKGLGNEAIRVAITKLFDADKAKAKGRQ